MFFIKSNANLEDVRYFMSESDSNTNDYLLYIIFCHDESLYTGITNDLPRRLAQHRSGKGARYVASRLPCTLVYTEQHESRSAALKREYQIKRMTRGDKLKFIRNSMDSSRAHAEAC